MTIGIDRMSREQLLRILREQEAEIASLADCVTMAAALWFGEIPPGSERDYASEVLHTEASALTKRYPRLRDNYRGADL